jgi:hypothetical protein
MTNSQKYFVHGIFCKAKVDVCEIKRPLVAERLPLMVKAYELQPPLT